MNSQTHWLWRRSTMTVYIFCLGMMLLFSQMISVAQAQGGPGGDQPILPLDKPDGKLSPRLEMLAQPAIAGQDAETQARTLSLAPTGPGSLLKNEQDQILVYIRLSTISEDTLTALAAAGATVIHVAEEYNIATAYVSPSSLLSVSDVEAVLSMREEVAPIVHGAKSGQPGDAPVDLSRSSFQADCTGATTSEGDTQLKADEARTIFGLDGTGITVGALSDSYNNFGGIPETTATDDVTSGDLPGATNPCGRTTPVTVLKEAPFSSDNSDEGRALLQIIHDLAPGANLAFATAVDGLFDFADQIRALRNVAGADVIVDDIAYLIEPFFQDGPISAAIQDVTTDGALYFTAAGNSHYEDADGNAITSYEAPAYRPTTCPVLFLEGNAGLPGKDCHDFDPTGGTDANYSFTLEAGASFILAFQWAEPWSGIQTDLDVYLVDGANNILTGSDQTNPGPTGTQIPVEIFFYENTTTSAQTVHLVIGRYSGTATPRIKYIVLLQSIGLTSVEYNLSNSTDIFGPTIFGHSGEDSAISVAAVPYNDANTPEFFTSRGFPTIYFGPTEGVPQPASALSSPDTRQKPDVGATDGNCTTFFGLEDVASNCFRFFGTSAAAPHAAAVGALMKEQANSLSKPLAQGFAESILEKTAATIANGSPQATGAGLINATAAITGVNDLEIRTVFLPVILKN